ncbi:hypothetical protein BGX27_006359 [Mortierella sp. AM989]|nr:hypothetical protein BGX27_006359 [Mortierella sp. AM989]
MAGNVLRQGKAISNQQTQRVEQICGSSAFEQTSVPESVVTAPSLLSHFKPTATVDAISLNRRSDRKCTKDPTTDSGIHPTRTIGTRMRPYTKAGKETEGKKRSKKTLPQKRQLASHWAYKASSSEAPHTALPSRTEEQSNHEPEEATESYVEDSVHRTRKETIELQQLDKDTEPSTLSAVSQAKHRKKRSFELTFTEGLQKTPKRLAPTPMPRIATTSVDSPNLIPTISSYEKLDLLVNDVNEDDFMLPDATEDSYRFSAILDGLDIGSSFGHLFQDVKAKKVYVTDIDQAFARSGIILISKVATAHQLDFLGGSFSAIREKALRNWKSVDVTLVRNEVRLWLDRFEDHDFDRAKCLEFLLSHAKEPKHQRLWTYFVSALQEFPSSDTTKVYSESTAISSFILPICRVFVSAPDKKLFLDFVDTANHAGKASISRKEPDLALNLKDDSNITICNIGIGEVTSMAQRGYKKKNAKDLVRIGGMLKNTLDYLQDDFGISDAVMPGWQVISQEMAIYVMFRCGNIYLMTYIKDVKIPDSLNDLKSLGADIKTWLELQATISLGSQDALEQASSGQRKIATQSTLLERVSTIGTPEFKTFLTKK